MRGAGNPHAAYDVAEVYGGIVKGGQKPRGAGTEGSVPRPFSAFVFSVELFSDGAHLTAFELADADRPAGLDGADQC